MALKDQDDQLHDKENEVYNQGNEGMKEKIQLLQFHDPQYAMQQQHNQEQNRIQDQIEERKFLQQPNQMQLDHQTQNQKHVVTIGDQQPQVGEIFNVINVEQGFEDDVNKLESPGKVSQVIEEETINGCRLHGILKHIQQEDNKMFEYD